jgi:hypothetical protein
MIVPKRLADAQSWGVKDQVVVDVDGKREMRKVVARRQGVFGVYAQPSERVDGQPRSPAVARKVKG